MVEPRDIVKPKRKSDERTELLRTLVITQLYLAGVTRHNIRKVVGGDMNRVTAVLRHFPKGKERDR